MDRSWAKRVALVLCLATLTAGCIDALSPQMPGDQGPLSPTNTTGSESADGSNGTDPSDNRSDQADNRSQQDDNGTQGAGDNGTGQPDHPPWPQVEEATIRPGVQVIARGSQCTANYVYRTPDNATLFLGLAAHCVEDLDIGDAVTIPSAKANATIAYTGWHTDNGTDRGNGLDFALLAIPDVHRGKVHPSVHGFGGPTGLATPGDINTGQRVIWYGDTGLHEPVRETNRHEGTVLYKNGQATFAMYTVIPGVPGDSGSPVMLSDGKAAGELTTLHITPTAGANDVVILHTALEQARSRGTAVELVTWSTFEGGLLPG